MDDRTGQQARKGDLASGLPNIKLPPMELYSFINSLDLDHLSDAQLHDLYDKALSLLPSRAPIYNSTDKMAIRDRIRGALRVFEIYKWRLDALYRPRLKALRETFRGRERCFIIGNGPSLNSTDLTQLRDEVTFAVNSFFLKVPDIDWLPTFFVVEDHLVAEDRAAWINALKGPTKLFPAYLGYCIEESHDAIFFNHRPRKSYPHGFDFSTDAAEITYTGCTVTFTVMQLAHYLGFRKLHLIGVDADYVIPGDVAQSSDYGVGVLDMKTDDTNHFHPDYFGKGFRWHDPQVEKMVEAYGEALKVTNQLGRPIVNSGIGGKLTVFPREPFNHIFPQAMDPADVAEKNTALVDQVATQPRGVISPKALSELSEARLRANATCEHTIGNGWGGRATAGFVRTLVVDFTEVGDKSATGELKATLFAGWPQTAFMQIFMRGSQFFTRRFGVASEIAGNGPAAISKLVDRALQFRPQVILFRPVAEKPELSEFVKFFTSVWKAPVLIWIMDDWPYRLLKTDIEGFCLHDDYLRSHFQHSNFGLSISSKMSSMLEARYGLPFINIANGIDPEEMAQVRAAASGRAQSGGAIRIAYAGGLSPEMGLQSLINVAQAVERLSARMDIKFEINTRDYWYSRYGSKFDLFRNTICMTHEYSRQDYLLNIASSDIVLIVYNFDEFSRVYTRTSLANKLPECMASGAALLAIGPEDFATIGEVQKYGAGACVTEEAIEPVMQAILKLTEPNARRSLIDRQIAVAEQYFSVFDKREMLRKCLLAASERTAPVIEQATQG